MTFLRLASSILAVALLPVLAACTGPIVLANGNGGSTTTTSTSSTSTQSTTTNTGTGGQSTGNACTDAGGTCGPITPGFCPQGTVGDPSMYPCGPGVGTGCCLPSTCPDPCPVEMLHQTRCSGGAIETCQIVGSCSSWTVTSACPSGEGCNGDGTKCIVPGTNCSTSADCGCGCGCLAGGTCACTGGLPPSCTKDSDCGADCSGFRCIGQQCQLAACIPGQDQTCNQNPAMSSFAGTCNADRTCTCKAGFTLDLATGKCM